MVKNVDIIKVSAVSVDTYIRKERTSVHVVIMVTSVTVQMTP